MPVIVMMIEDEKVTHPTLFPGQYLYVRDMYIYDENDFEVGHMLDPMFGEQSNEWDTNWTIYKKEMEVVNA